MRVAVIDGQGGGIGKAIVENLKAAFSDSLQIVALGTNALAASAMLRAGASEGASGENAIAVMAQKVDVIIGSVAIIAANSMLGELTPVMARAIAESDARKILIPLNRCNLYVAGVQNGPLPHYIDSVIDMIRKFLGGN
jgi:NAD(P)-dependent dehydrogenase (short-subunit alcohol dehydrogenase family)